MSLLKKIMCAVLAALIFVGVTAVFVRGLTGSMSFLNWMSRGEQEEIYYHRPTEEAVPEKTEPPEETVPEETILPETQPPETVPEETAARIVYEQVPLYDQMQYPHILYRSGTVATSGSNIVSLAMVASYLTGHEYLPDALAGYFADFIGNSMQWLENASEELQLPWQRAANIDVAIQALREGKIAVVLMNENSLFMESQHFVVFTGITDEGKILVNDPCSLNYEKWNLKNALASGFNRSDLTGGYGAAWIYDPTAMPEEPFIYVEEPNPDVFRYPGLELTQEDKDLMAKLLCAEAESEPFEGQQAIAEVILNRLAAGNFQSSINGIIYAEGQFAAAQNLYLAKPTHTQYEAIERAMYGPYVLPADVVFFAKFAVNDNVWGTIGSHTFCHQW